VQEQLNSQIKVLFGEETLGRPKHIVPDGEGRFIKLLNVILQKTDFLITCS